MSVRYRIALPIVLVLGVALAGLGLGGAFGPSGAGPGASPGASAGPDGQGQGGPDATAIPTPEPTPRPPIGGTELYGFLPYWQFSDAVAEHLRSTPVTTLGLFSVSARRNGALNSNPLGYRRITGDVGARLIQEAHDRGTRVELVFTSFGETRNGRLFGRIGTAPSGSPGVSPDPATPGNPPWRRTVTELVDLAAELGLDGIAVDVERLADEDRTAYGEFLTELGATLRARLPDARLTVATEAGDRGVANAATAAAAGVDRVFLMGYDYHWSGSQPGASSPVDRLDGAATLRRSIVRYVEAGVPRDRILLGLPLYGMTWRTIGPSRGFVVIGTGIPWIPAQHLDTLLDPTFAPTRDEVELAEWFAVADSGDWLITYYDSPATLRSKLALARDQGLAGGGFWALGYERGLPGYSELMREFTAGDVPREAAPAPQP